MEKTNSKPPIFQKLIRKPILWLIFFSFMFSWPIVQSVTRKLPPPLKLLGKFPSFSYSIESGEVITEKAFKNKLTIFSLIKDGCSTICPGNMAILQKIQKRVRGLGHKIAIISHKVTDSPIAPAEFKKVALDYHANSFIWHFTSGNSPDLNHKKNESLFLVDEKGFIRGKYVKNTSDINRMMIEIGLLANNTFAN